MPVASASQSPFLTAPRLNGHILTANPKTEQLVQIMDELYDEEFEEAIDGLLNEASDLSKPGPSTSRRPTMEVRRATCCRSISRR
jgi:hypothetical protein